MLMRKLSDDDFYRPVTFDEIGQAGPVEPDHLDYQSSLRGMVDRDYCRSWNIVVDRSRVERTGAYPALVDFERLFYRRMMKLGIPVIATTFVRSLAVSDEVYEGIGEPELGPHFFGCAIDLAHATKGFDLVKLQWEIFGHVGSEVIGSKWPIRWGGLSNPAHWEVEGWRKLRGKFPWPSTRIVTVPSVGRG